MAICEACGGTGKEGGAGDVREAGAPAPFAENTCRICHGFGSVPSAKKPGIKKEPATAVPLRPRDAVDFFAQRRDAFVALGAIAAAGVALFAFWAAIG